MSSLTNHLYIVASLFFGITSQLLMRWQMRLAGELPVALDDKFFYIVKVFLSPWVMLAFVCTFLAGVSWMLVLTKFDLSYAYPYTSLQFLVILGFGALVFGEPFTLGKLLGTFCVAVGLILIARG